MKKEICDLCKNDLKIYRQSPDYLAPIARWWNYYIFKKFELRSMGYFNFFPSLPSFVSPFTNEKIEICSNCFDDFKEFIERKKSYRENKR